MVQGAQPPNTSNVLLGFKSKLSFLYIWKRIKVKCWVYWGCFPIFPKRWHLCFFATSHTTAMQIFTSLHSSVFQAICSQEVQQCTRKLQINFHQVELLELCHIYPYRNSFVHNTAHVLTTTTKSIKRCLKIWVREVLATADSTYDRALIGSHRDQTAQHRETTTTLHSFNGFFSRTTWVSQHQKGKPFWILLKQDMIGWQWHQLDHMQIICTTLQTYNHGSTPSLNFVRAGCSSWRPAPER